MKRTDRHSNDHLKSSQPSTFKVPQNPGPHKNQKRLDARVRDWETVQSKSGFHKPGSYNK